MAGAISPIASADSIHGQNISVVMEIVSQIRHAHVYATGRWQK